MGPSEKAFQQVRSILGKLDANIEQMRAQRTRGPVAAPAGGVANADRVIGAGIKPSQPARPNAPAQPNAPQRAPGLYGRATPMPPKSH